MCLLTTAHSAQMRITAVRDQEGNAVQKPACILSYNTKMGGVDMVDQQLYSLTVMRQMVQKGFCAHDDDVCP